MPALFRCCGPRGIRIQPLRMMTITLNGAYSFTLVATPTAIHAQAFSLLDVDPTKLSPVT